MNGFEFLAWGMGGFLILSIISSVVMAIVFLRSRKKSVEDFKKRHSKKFGNIEL